MTSEITNAQVLPWVPIIGYAIRLTRQDGEIIAILNVIAQNTDEPQKRALEIANEIAELVST